MIGGRPPLFWMMRTVAIKAERDIAVEAEDTKALFWKTPPLEISVYPATPADSASMLCPAAIGMIYREKLDMAFAATFALPAIRRNDFLFQQPRLFFSVSKNGLSVFRVVLASFFPDLLALAAVIHAVFFALWSFLPIPAARD